MALSGKTALCVLCQKKPASRKGEHVWPSWYLSEEDRKGSAPSGWSHNGEPIRDRNNQPIKPLQRVRVQLPVCISCNGCLEGRFETPTKDVLRRLFAGGGAVVLSAAQAELAGEWFAKTFLLLAHPAARYGDERIERIVDLASRLARSDVPPREFYSWLIDGSPPPSGLSLWMHRADAAADDKPRYRVPLPRVTADGRTLEFIEFQVALHGVCVTLVVHPGWPIRHPLEATGEAVRLLPSADQPVDLTRLPVLWPQVVAWTGCAVDLRPGVLGTPGPPPLRASRHILQVLPEVLPLTTSWRG